MSFDPIAAALAREQTEDLAFSALPHAPVRPHRERRAPRSVRWRIPRARLAAALHRVAVAVEPPPVQPCVAARPA